MPLNTCGLWKVALLLLTANRYVLSKPKWFYIILLKVPIRRYACTTDSLVGRKAPVTRSRGSIPIAFLKQRMTF